MRDKGVKCAAIVLAAGQGKRMNTDIHKQYLLIKDKPVLYYALNTIECSFIDEIILVVGKGEISYCEEKIVKRYHFHKVVKIVEGGKERYHSVKEGLKAIQNCDYVFVHDGARPFIDLPMLERALEGAQKYQACIVGMPVKDTIRIVDDYNIGKDTPRRDRVWMMQTPQVFSFTLLKEAYEKIMNRDCSYITDDAMVVEAMKGIRPKLVMGAYTNIKITTRDDLMIAEGILAQHSEITLPSHLD